MVQVNNCLVPSWKAFSSFRLSNPHYFDLFCTPKRSLALLVCCVCSSHFCPENAAVKKLSIGCTTYFIKRVIGNIFQSFIEINMFETCSPHPITAQKAMEDLGLRTPLEIRRAQCCKTASGSVLPGWGKDNPMYDSMHAKGACMRCWFALLGTWHLRLSILIEAHIFHTFAEQSHRTSIQDVSLQHSPSTRSHNADPCFGV